MPDPIFPDGTFRHGAGFDFRQRSNLLELDRQLYTHWGLGQNLALAWCPHPTGIQVLVVPHHAVAAYGAVGDAESPADNSLSPAHQFIMHLLSGSRQFTARQMNNATHLLGVEAIQIRLRQALSGTADEGAVIDQIVKRYSVSYIHNRAVALFDIVGFSLLSPFEQMTQLSSLSCSLNAAHSRLMGRRMLVDFARSTTGDGFYIWNRDAGLEANTNLYHFMHLVLADNAIAGQKAAGRTVPLLRTSFHIGNCYEFHHAEGLNPTMYCDIVGDVTIELARMVEHALPGQILVGDFLSETISQEPVTGIAVNAISFIEQAQNSLSQLNGLELSGEAVESIKCYLTGEACADGTFTIRKLAIHDKHGLSRNAFNAKVNIHRRGATPILLGIEDKLLCDDERYSVTRSHVKREERYR